MGQKLKKTVPNCDATTSAGGVMRSCRTREAKDKKDAPGDWGAAMATTASDSCPPPYIYAHHQFPHPEEFHSGDTHCGKPHRPPLHGAVPRHPKGHLSALPRCMPTTEKTSAFCPNTRPQPPAKEELIVAVGAIYGARALSVPYIVPNWPKLTAQGTSSPTSTLASSAAASASLQPTELL